MRIKTGDNQTSSDATVLDLLGSTSQIDRDGHVTVTLPSGGGGSAANNYFPPRNPVDLPTEIVPATIDDNTYSGLGTTLFGTDGRIVIVYPKRPHNIGVGNYGKLVSRFSRDQGKTWSAETVIEDNTASLIDIRDCSGGTTRTTRMIIFYAWYNPANLTNNGGIGYFTKWLYRYSDDNGVTWSNAITYYTGTNTDWSAAGIGQLTEIAQGKLIHVWWRWFTSNGLLSGVTATCRAIFSSDNGATWGGEVVIGSSTSPTLDYTESCAAYLGGGAIVVMARTDHGTTYSQFLSTDNGATWTSQGLWGGDSWTVPAPPTLVTYEDPTLGTRRVAMYYTNRDAQRIRVTTAKAVDLINSGTAAWSAYTNIVTTSSVDSAYQTVIHPFGDPRGFGWFYDNPGDDTANIVFFTYTAPVSGIPTTGIGALIEHVVGSDLTVTGTSGSQQAWIGGASHSYDGITNIEIRVQCPIAQVTNGAIVLEVWEDGVSLGRIAELTTASTNEGIAIGGSLFKTPSSGSHTYVIKVWQSGTSPSLYGGSPFIVGSAFLRITTAA